MDNEPNKAPYGDSDHAIGVTLGVYLDPADKGSSYWAPRNFQARTKEIAHECGVGVRFIQAHDTNLGSLIIGVIAHSGPRDPHGHLIGFLRRVCKTFHQGSALYCSHNGASWELLDMKGAGRNHTRTDIGALGIDNPGPMVKALAGHQNSDAPSAADLVGLGDHALDNVTIAHEPNGWLGRWRDSLAKPQNPSDRPA
jgi:hypothetical protein